MDRTIRLILAVFATYRLASLISTEEGPYAVFDRLRMNLGAYDYGRDGRPETLLGRGISCVLCTGVYISFGLVAFVFLPTLVGDLFLAWLGIAGGQIFLENLTSDDVIAETVEKYIESTD